MQIISTFYYGNFQQKALIINIALRLRMSAYAYVKVCTSPYRSHCFCCVNQVVIEEESDDEIVEVDDKELPEILRQLINVSGRRLIATPNNTWNVDGYAA